MIETRGGGQARVSLRLLARSLLCWALAMPFLAGAAATTTSPDSKVQQQVASIETRWKARSPWRERPLGGFSAEGARVLAWGTAPSIEKISVEGLGERGRVLLDFYWQRGRLIAAHTRRVDYGAHITELPKDKPTPTTVVEEEWLEFQGDRLLRWRHPDRELSVGDPSARLRAAELKAQARSFRRLVNAPEPPKSAGGGCTWSCSSEQRGECLRYRCE